jgi:pimeloyl-ACP methyl ester carboxylesterase
MNLKTTWLAWLVIFSLQSSIVFLCAAPQKELPLPGEVFVVDGRTAFLIAAKSNGATKTKPWVWYAPTLPGLPGREEQWMFKRFLEAGIAIGGIDVGESYGSPAGRKFFTEFHAEMTRTRRYSSKPVLLGRSRGGLMTLSWAAENPNKVGGFAGIYPVSNFASYPGTTNAAGAYGIKPEELQAQLAEQNPIERLAPLAWAGVPLFAIHGDVDKVVPLELNSGLLHERYVALGGSMQLIIPPGQGHNMWPGFFQNEDLVSFVKAHAGPNITIASPLEYQVVQRSKKGKGSLLIRGELAGVTLKATLTIQARLVLDGKPRKWRKLEMDPKRRIFRAELEVPAGGWHRVEVRALSGGDVIAESVIEHVGIGEVFVIAGQSNSANHGAEKQNPKTGLVAAFDGTRWRLAHDPQPGASGEGGSFIPPFGDAIVQKFHVPVGIVACGVGATSVREWLAKDATFPNPPTLTNNVRRLSSDVWESTGTLFATFIGRMKQLGPQGFRAVLWHQGESDANQDDSTRTLPGNLYRDYLEQLINTSRREIGWKAPWFVAQASYHVPGDEGSPDIRAAQASLWKDGLALEGPDSDSIKGDLRENGGKGVHFSGPGLREHAARWFDKVAPWLERNK